MLIQLRITLYLLVSCCLKCAIRAISRRQMLVVLLVFGSVAVTITLIIRPIPVISSSYLTASAI